MKNEKDEPTNAVNPADLTYVGVVETPAPPVGNTATTPTECAGPPPPPPETESDGPTLDKKPAPKPIKLSDNARIIEIDTPKAATVICKRSTAEILGALSNMVSRYPDPNTALIINIRIELDGEEVQEDKSTKPIVLVVDEGPLNEVATRVARSTMHPNGVLQEFQRMCEFMAGRSSLKGILITAVFGDASVAGFGYVSSCSDVTDADMVTLAEGAANQSNLFKDNIRKQRPNLVFPSDEAKSKLILPPRFRK